MPVLFFNIVPNSETDDVSVCCVALSCLKCLLHDHACAFRLVLSWNLTTGSRLSQRVGVALIQGGGRPVARAEVNRGIIVRHAPVNCGLYCWSRAGQQLQTGFELPTDNNGAAVLLVFSLSPGEQASAPHWAAVKHHKAILKSMSHAT